MGLVPVRDKSDPPNLARLCASCERPHGGSAAEKRNELPPSHSITSSASCWSLSGTSRPKALAVLRLITSSNLVGCSTGNSAGLAPRITLATIWPVCHHIRERLGPYESSPPASACSFH